MKIVSLKKKCLNEQWSIKNGSLRGANAESTLDDSKRTHHPYHWAAKAFAGAREVEDWEQVPEQTTQQTEAKLQKLDIGDLVRKWIYNTMKYD